MLTSLATELSAHLAEVATMPARSSSRRLTAAKHHYMNFYSSHYKPAVARAGLDQRTRFHDLRHTAAALMVAQGAHLRVVKQRLGHSSIAVTAHR